MFLSKPTKIKASRQGDKDFIITDGFTLSPRAAIEICGSMPYEYQLIITECMKNQWLRPVAYQHVHEDLIEKLTK